MSLNPSCPSWGEHFPDFDVVMVNIAILIKITRRLSRFQQPQFQLLWRVLGGLGGIVGPPIMWVPHVAFWGFHSAQHYNSHLKLILHHQYNLPTRDMENILTNITILPEHLCRNVPMSQNKQYYNLTWTPSTTRGLVPGLPGWASRNCP